MRENSRTARDPLRDHGPALYADERANAEWRRPRADYAENELPQPQPPVEFGFLNVKPDPCMDVT